jgi:hypothetical protein
MNEEPLIIGRDLVEFDRRGVPLYQEPPSLWGDAGIDPVPYGAPLDRLFGEPGETHVVGYAAQQEVVLPMVEDVLVELGTLSDALALPEHAVGLLETVFSSDLSAAVPLHDSWSGDGFGVDWSSDFPG